MITDRIIICIASGWDYDPTGKHHVMRILARHNRVVWVNHHGSRVPSITVSDLKAAGSRLAEVTRGVRPIGGAGDSEHTDDRPNMVQVTPLVIPGAAGRLGVRINRALLIRQIGRAIRAVSGDRQMPVQVWTFAPDVPYLAGAFHEERFVYYCVDDYASFAGYDATAIGRAESELLQRADVVLTSSKALWESKLRHRPDTALVPHGVAFDQFAEAWRGEIEEPADVRAIPRPIFGFFGLIHHWIDVDLIAAVAKLRPGYSFVLIGEAKADIDRLKNLPNVHLLGRRNHDHLPAYCRAFSAGLMPFARNRLTDNVNPIKMWEYLAAGLPVISTSLPEARRHGGPVRIADTPGTFAAACDAVVASSEDQELRGADLHARNADSGAGLRARRAAVAATVAHLSWNRKVEEISALVEAGRKAVGPSRVARRGRSPNPPAPSRGSTAEPCPAP